MIRVLFVCSGNICRSPMADAVFMDRVQKAGLSDKITCDSAGTGPWHVGEQANRGTLHQLEIHGIDYDGRARQLSRADVDAFDYVLAMDETHLLACERLAGGSRPVNVSLFMQYAVQAGLSTETEVPDPYYDGRFQEVYDLVDVGCDALLDHIRQQHNL